MNRKARDYSLDPSEEDAMYFLKLGPTKTSVPP